MGPGVLYQVKASYKYQAEDVDELNFEVGEVINVVEYEDPEEKGQHRALDPGGNGTDPDLILKKSRSRPSRKYRSGPYTYKKKSGSGLERALCFPYSLLNLYDFSLYMFID